MARPKPDERRGQPADPCAIALFGASGDLAKRKLFPALLNLRRSGLLSDELAVLGLGTTEMTSEAFRERLDRATSQTFAPEDVGSELWKWLASSGSTTFPATSAPPTSTPGSGTSFARSTRPTRTRGNVLFYLATPPDFFGDIVEQLGQAGLTAAEGDAWRRVIVEKPFGNSSNRPAS